jgi:hypothetical protein
MERERERERESKWVSGPMKVKNIFEKFAY